MLCFWKSTHQTTKQSQICSSNRLHSQAARGTCGVSLVAVLGSNPARVTCDKPLFLCTYNFLPHCRDQQVNTRKLSQFPGRFGVPKHFWCGFLFLCLNLNSFNSHHTVSFSLDITVYWHVIHINIDNSQGVECFCDVLMVVGFFSRVFSDMKPGRVFILRLRGRK